MAAPPTPHPSPVQPARVDRPDAINALVPSERLEREAAGFEIDGPVARLPVELDVGVPIRDFRVRNLLALVPGAVIASQWPHADDLPVRAGHESLAWSEFEVVDVQLAVRITRLP